MSARDVIADALQNTPEGQSEWGNIGRAEQILDALRAAGYVVGKVPDRRHTTTPVDGYNAGWNACRAAMLASEEETP